MSNFKLTIFQKIVLLILAGVMVIVIMLFFQLKNLGSEPIKSITSTPITNISPKPITASAKPMTQIATGEKLDLRKSILKDTNNWTEFKGKLLGIEVIFKYPRKLKMVKSGNAPEKYEALQYYLDDQFGNSVIYFGRAGRRFINENFKDWVLKDEIFQESNYVSPNDTNRPIKISDFILPSSEGAIVYFSEGYALIPHISGEMYFLKSGKYPFYFANSENISKEEFLTILDSFKTIKCLDKCE